jgi:hypothetical protein
MIGVRKEIVQVGGPIFVPGGFERRHKTIEVKPR